jgi:hypothetical protein
MHDSCVLVMVFVMVVGNVLAGIQCNEGGRGGPRSVAFCTVASYVGDVASCGVVCHVGSWVMLGLLSDGRHGCETDG